MKRVILVHGIFSDGEASIDLLEPLLKQRGYDVIQYHYGPRGPLGSLLFQNRDATGLLELYRPGDVVIGHSNGAKLIAIAVEKGMPVEHAILIHAALDVDWTPPVNHPMRRVDIYWSRQDKATWLAQWSPWKMGGMGTYGPSIAHPTFNPVELYEGHSKGFVDNPSNYVESLNG